LTRQDIAVIFNTPSRLAILFSMLPKRLPVDMASDQNIRDLWSVFPKCGKEESPYLNIVEITPWEIWGSHSDGCKEYSLMGNNSVLCQFIPNFRRLYCLHDQGKWKITFLWSFSNFLRENM